MRNLVQKQKLKIDLILQRIFKGFLRRISPSERNFNRIWPIIDTIEGFLVSPIQERWLYKMARSLPNKANIVEIGSFKGRSTCCLAYGCKGRTKHVFAIDTFDGNDIDFNYRCFFKDFWHNIEKCGLTAYVTPIQGHSSEVAKTWNKPIQLLFIDGSHQYEHVLSDFNEFFPHVISGGIVALHDVDPRGLSALDDNIAWPGPLRAWHKHIKYHLNQTGACNSIAFGRKPKIINEKNLISPDIFVR